MYVIKRGDQYLIGGLMFSDHQREALRLPDRCSQAFIDALFNGDPVRLVKLRARASAVPSHSSLETELSAF